MTGPGDLFPDPPAGSVPEARGPAPTVEVLHLAGCEHTPETVALARSVAAQVFPGAAVRAVLLDEPGFLARGVPGSPTVLVDGRDVAGREAAPSGLIA